MSVARHDSLAGKLLQKQADAPPVGAGLPANVGVRKCLLTATHRQQAGSDNGSSLMAPKTYSAELYLAWACLTE
jgi:hypothetical protein